VQSQSRIGTLLWYNALQSASPTMPLAHVWVAKQWIIIALVTCRPCPCSQRTTLSTPRH